MVSNGFASGKTLSIDYRRGQLERLCLMLCIEEERLVKALCDDFKSYHEAMAEVKTITSELVKAMDNLSSWTKAEKLSKGLVYYFDDCSLNYEPLGVALIIGAWNYPLDLVLEPLIGAICAGCTVILKPSEVSFHTSSLLAELIPKYLDADCCSIVTGGVPETSVLLDWPKWNLIFYTGSSKVGKIIKSKAASNLIPTVLELGGKSPCIVSSKTDILITAKRIIFGKLFNAGQTCVAPDYILCTSEALVEPLKNALIETIKLFYGDDPSTSTSYSRIINTGHWDRLKALTEEESLIVSVGNSNRDSLYFAPTLVLDPSVDSKLMTEEIFGPILPILTMSNLDSAIEFINKRERPLSLYLFSTDSTEVQTTISKTSSGSVCVNDTVMQIFSNIFPLGGVGASGMGRYKGKWSFETFSHSKPVMWRGQSNEWINDRTRNPPHSDTSKFALMSKVIFTKPNPSRHFPKKS